MSLFRRARKPIPASTVFDQAMRDLSGVLVDLRGRRTHPQPIAVLADITLRAEVAFRLLADNGSRPTDGAPADSAQRLYLQTRALREALQRRDPDAIATEGNGCYELVQLLMEEPPPPI